MKIVTKASFIIVRTWKLLKCPLTGDWYSSHPIHTKLSVLLACHEFTYLYTSFTSAWNALWPHLYPSHLKSYSEFQLNCYLLTEIFPSFSICFPSMAHGLPLLQYRSHAIDSNQMHLPMKLEFLLGQGLVLICMSCSFNQQTFFYVYCAEYTMVNKTNPVCSHASCILVRLTEKTQTKMWTKSCLW